MAVNISLDDSFLPHDESAEEAFERAVAAWRTTRARFETVDPAQLPPMLREEYFRLMARIGLWADARVTAADDARGDDDDALDVVEVESG